jgi:hypothetical protein
MDKKESASSGIGVGGLLGVVFVTLKLLGVTDVATWSWWWVTAPFWLVPAALLAFALVVGAVGLLLAGFFAFMEHRRSVARK